MSSSGARVFVRLYDGAAHREGDAQLVMLPPPPLTWKRVLAMMVMAVTKQDTEPDDQALASVRLFLLPTDAQGIVAELNARALRFGVRDNDQFAICLHGEEYKRVEGTENGQDDDADAVAALAAMAAVTGPLPSVISMKARLNDEAPAVETTAPSVPASSSAGPPRSNLFSTSAAPPAGNMMDHSSAIRKATKRYRSISGKMAAIKSLGDKGLISAEDRGHLKDLLLNNDSPALQEALDAYQNTGDFQAVKDLLMKELRNPSNKRGTSDWLPESLINDLSENFQTHDAQDGDQPYGRYGQQHTAGYNTAQPANPFMHSTQPTAYESPSASSDYTAITEGDAVHPMSAMGTTYEQQQAWSASQAMGTAYTQQTQTASMSMYASTTPSAHINLPLRDRNSVNLMLKHRTMDGTAATMDPTQTSMMHGNPVEIGYVTAANPYAQGYAQGYAPVSYATASTGYSYAGMNPYGSAMPTTTAYGAYYAQPGAVAYSMSPYGHPQYANVAAMQGYSYYGAAGGAYGYMKPGHPGRIGGKWTNVPPMPAYPPPCSKEEKKEKIARWLKKRENRNWSNKPSYPVRHNIAKNRKRGEDGRFITKARLAEMEAEAAARGATGGEDGDDQEDGSGSDSETNAMPVAQFDTSDFPPLPQATPVHN